MLGAVTLEGLLLVVIPAPLLQGGLGTKDWFLAVAKPTFSVESYPTLDDLVAFRIPPGVSIKLEAGTWHAGPLFDDDDHMDFFNLELSDTNVVDHNTHVYDAPLTVIV